MVGGLLRRLEEDPADRGFTEAAGGQGSCPLLLRPDGDLWKIAGGPVRGSGRSNCGSGGCGEDLEVRSVSDQRVMQVFVVAFGVCGEGKG